MSDAIAPALGIFGGTFDPPHIGHLRLALEAREALGLAEVCLIPAGRPALREAPYAAAADRLAMVRLAVQGHARFSVDAAEVLDSAGAPRPSYTVETLERLRRQHGPSRALVLLLGADAFARLEAWHRWRDLFKLAHIAVATRPGNPLILGAGDTALDGEFVARQGSVADLATAPAGRIVSFAITALDISASDVRRRLALGLSARHLVPDSVLDYIDSHLLYRTPHGH